MVVVVVIVDPVVIGKIVGWLLDGICVPFVSGCGETGGLWRLVCVVQKVDRSKGRGQSSSQTES